MKKRQEYVDKVVSEWMKKGGVGRKPLTVIVKDIINTKK
jgi:hypothetical protein